MTTESTCDELYDISFTNAEELEEEREREESSFDEDADTVPLPSSWETPKEVKEQILYHFDRLFTPKIQYLLFAERYKKEQGSSLNDKDLDEWIAIYAKNCQPIIHELETNYQHLQELLETEKVREKQHRAELNAQVAKETALNDQIEATEERLRQMRAEKQQATRNANKLRHILGEEESCVCNQICTPLTARPPRVIHMDASQIDADLLEVMEPSQKKQKH